QLSAFGAGSLVGITDSGFRPEANRWSQFVIQVEDVGGSTSIRARFWSDADPEPQTFAINAVDTSAGRLTSGRIGIWSSGGDVFFDDLYVRSSVDRPPSSIIFVDASTK